MKPTRKLKYVLSFLVSVILISTFAAPSFIQKHKSTNTNPSIADTLRLKNDLTKIISFGYRNYQNISVLDSVANYIKHEFLKISDSVHEQVFIVQGKTYRNIICTINTDKPSRIIVGAHYDVCGDQDGADDNGSGVVGLLELARLMKNKPSNYRIDFVAYSLEEPPFFGTESMGSFVHAKYVYEEKIDIKGMICLEMLGYYSDKDNSQDYPVSFLKWFYGDRGNYITLVEKFNNGKFSNSFNDLMKKSNRIETKTFTGPSSLVGIDFSDHRNYWKFGYSAVMVTNTAFFRNHNYHETTDNIETLDFRRLALVIDEVVYALNHIK